jgi:hypothetical protein
VDDEGAGGEEADANPKGETFFLLITT